MLLAAFAMTLVPTLAPVAKAAPGGQSRLELALDAARRGQAVVLTPPQWDSLKQKRPELFQKLNTARMTRTVPQLSYAERAHVQQLTNSTLNRIRAGQAAAAKSGEASTKITVTPAESALTACISVFTGASAAFPGIGSIIGGILCVLIIIPLVVDFLRLIFGKKEAAFLALSRAAAPV